MSEKQGSRRIPSYELFIHSLCCAIAVWNRFERWFDLDMQA